MMLENSGVSSAASRFGVESRVRFSAQVANERGAASRESGSTSSTSSANSDHSETVPTLPVVQVDRLTSQEQQLVAQLKEVDRLVRAHEQAHLAVGAELVRGGASFTYQRGPDDERYAVAGEVSIDVSPAATPPETLSKAQRIRAAALAPADPSSQDQSVAAQAVRMASEARMELAVQQQAAAISADRGNARFYQGVVRDGSEQRLVGARLDLFA